MKRHQKWLAVLTAACMAVPLFALAACGGDKEQNKANVDSDIWAVYTAYAEAAGDDALSYDEWYAQLLATAKGDPGDDGKSAYEIWQEHHPEEETTEDEWLESLKGENGAPGAKGNGWYYGSGAPEAETGSVGDLYLDYATWDVYAKQASGEGAEWKYLGNLTGKAQRHTIAASGTYEMPIDLEAGVYELTVELDEGVVTADGLTAKVGDEGVLSYLYNSKDNTYWGALLVKEGDTKVTITNNTSGNIVAGFKLTEYKAPTIELGKEYVLPGLAYDYGVTAAKVDQVKIPVDASLNTGTKYDITATPCNVDQLPTKAMAGGMIMVAYGEFETSGSSKNVMLNGQGSFKSDYDSSRVYWTQDETPMISLKILFMPTASQTPVNMNVVVKIETPAA